MKWIKAGTSGFIAALIMFALMYFGIHITGVAPFQVPPSAAFLISLGVAQEMAKPIALALHFGYGIFWSIVLLAVFWDRMSVTNGLGLSLFLWFFMMVVYSPVIGWGVFGLNPGSHLDEILALSSGLKYIIVTLVLHLIYGSVIGWMNSVWINFGDSVAEEIRSAAEEDRIME